MTQTHSGTYFDRFPGFEPDQQCPLNEEFACLASFKGWQTGSKQYKREQKRFLHAEYDLHLGSVELSQKLDAWQALCQELRINPTPRSITQCKKALHKVHVNIIDLVDSRRQHTQVKVFATRQKLVAYTIKTDKIYPKNKAKENVLLKILLRDIF